MKGIYLSTSDLNQKESGVSKKIKMQLLNFQNHGIDMLAPDFSGKKYSKYINTIFALNTHGPSLFSYRLKKFFNETNLSEIDVIYIRKTSLDSLSVKVLKTIKKVNPEIKILMEIPTYPYDQEYDGFVKKLLLKKDKKYRGNLYSIIDRIITFSDDDFIFNIPTIRLSNSVDINKVKPKKVSNAINCINIIAVAVFANWHGYDRFLYGLSSYYKNGGDKKIILHLVGNGSELERYKDIVKDTQLEEHVVFYGKKSGDELDKIYDLCDIGLDSMGRHRSGINFNSSLKGKEYGAKGLPIISGVETELDSINDYKYYMRVPANDDKVDINEVLTFYTNIYNGEETKQEIINNIRNFTQKHFDVGISFKSVVDYIKDDED